MEGTTETEIKYYYAASRRIAMRTDGTLNWLFSDHLSSTTIVTDESGTIVSEMKYTAFGEIRSENGVSPTDYTYTGQRFEVELGLSYYVARWFDPSTAHFVQADSLIPQPGNAGDWDRYAYVLWNPMKYTDPSGHYYNDDIIPGLANDSSWWSYQNPNQYNKPYIVPRKKNENGDGWGNYYTSEVVSSLTEDQRETLDPNDVFGGYYEYEGDLSDIYDTEVIHHVGAPGVPWNTPEEVETHHMETLGYYDVGYHFLIGADGTIYEGRDIGARGYHVALRNSGKVGVVLLANFDLVEPTDAQIQALTDLTIYLDHALGIDYVYGHNDFNNPNLSTNTNCPGINGYPLVDMMRQILEAK